MEKKKMDKGTKICIIIMIIAILAVIVTYFVTNMQNRNYTNVTYNNISEKENKNPYTVSNQYDGTYSFKMESNTNSGYAYLSVGIITFDNGNCNAKYIVQGESTSYDNKYEFSGYCGLNTDKAFYFSLNNDQYIYKCEPKDNTLNCVLKSNYDLCGNTNPTLNLELLDKSEDIDVFYAKYVNDEKTKWKTEIEQKRAEEKARKEAEENAKKEAEEKAKAEEEQNFKASCNTYTFEQMARNPDNFKGTNVKLTGEVIQALYGTNSVDLRVNITKKGNYSTYYTDTIYVTYKTAPGEDKILEDDIITIYGTSMGDYSYTSTMGAKITLPLISAKYITINN